MSSKNILSGINKSTKITFLSCVGFVVLTCLILLVFVMFPITPSEKIMASIGRENVLNRQPDGSPMTAVPVVVTTDKNAASAETSKTTSAVSTTKRTVKIVITSGSGFLWNGRIPTGIVAGGNTQTTVVEDPVLPTPDPGLSGGDPQTPTYPYPDSPWSPGIVDDPGETPWVPGVDDPGETPWDPGTEIPPSDNPENPGTEYPPSDNPDPGISNPPPEIPDTPVVEEPVQEVVE